MAVQSSPAPRPNRPVGAEPFSERKSLSSYRRLIVLVPTTRIDEQRLIERTINLASLNRAEVLFLGVSPDRTQTDDARHRLGVIASKVRGAVVAYSQVLPDANWIAALHKVLRPTDSVLMPADLASSLEPDLAALRIPVFRIADLRPSLTLRLYRTVARLLFESAPLLIIIGFLWLQSEIGNQTSGYLNVALTVLSLIVELGLIVTWSLFLE